MCGGRRSGGCGLAAECCGGVNWCTASRKEARKWDRFPKGLPKGVLIEGLLEG